MKTQVVNLENMKVSDVELSDEIFAAKPNMTLIYEVIKMQLAGKRSGSAATRNHKLVSGTTAKMYRQKGTGRARHGDARTNIFVGGGKAFGPHPRDYSYSMPKKAKKIAILSALSLKNKKEQLMIVDELAMGKIKTKEAVLKISQLGLKKALFVVETVDDNFSKSVKNIPGMKLLKFQGLNVYDIMNHEHVVLTLPALNKVQEAYKGI